jgi:methionine-S-sulfoxide reductase
VVKVTFDADVINLEDVLDIFWAMHNPTTLNFQGNDKGTQYRSIILFSDEEQNQIISESLKSVRRLWDDQIVTEIKPLEVFYPAEDEHQNYFQKHPEMGYCQVIINPKLKKLRQKFSSRLKQD